jgi:glycosyltransferase involved in cell wall biosynthesis
MDRPDGSIALVHDYLLVLRGAERTFASLADTWPDAPVYTLLYDEAGTQRRFADHEVTPSFLQRTGASQKNFRRLLPLYPLAVERLPLKEHRVIVSSSSAFAHGVRPTPDAVHVCYCHSPFRYAWFERERALAEAPRPARPVLAGVLKALRHWDRRAAGRVTRYVANSQGTRKRIQRLYGTDAPVVHPPVEVERFSRQEEPEDYFLTVGEIVPHKQVELAAEAATRSRQRLKVVGSGPDLERLRSEYGSYVDFVGRVDDTELESLYAKARALVVPNVEEFGIAAVEAQAAGRPVIGVRAGGVVETVVEEKTGTFVEPGSVDDMARALGSFDDDRFEAGEIREHSQHFSSQAFRSRMRQQVEEAVAA